MTDTVPFSAQRAATLEAAELLACLPESMRRSDTLVTRIAAGMSGAGVYRVETAESRFALKITSPDEPLQAWRTKLRIQRAAANVGIAPMVVHADETRRAIVSAFVADKGFFTLYGNPATHSAAIDRIAAMLRLMHSLPIDATMSPADPMAFLDTLERAVPGGANVPSFVVRSLEQLRRDTLDAAHSARDSSLVLSHNDVNPSNLVFDGEAIMLLDWQTPAPNDRYYDLATAALFLRMDHARCLQLLSSYTGQPHAEIPPRFTLLRRTAALMSGMASLHVARELGHAGGTEPHIAGGAQSLSDVYAGMRTGAVQLGTPDGQWAFGLALARESVGEASLNTPV